MILRPRLAARAWGLIYLVVGLLFLAATPYLGIPGILTAVAMAGFFGYLAWPSFTSMVRVANGKILYRRYSTQEARLADIPTAIEYSRVSRRGRVDAAAELPALGTSYKLQLTGAFTISDIRSFTNYEEFYTVLEQQGIKVERAFRPEKTI